MKLKLLIPLLLALKDWIAFQIAIPWSQVIGNPYEIVYRSVLVLFQATITNIIVFNHLVEKEAKKNALQKI